MSLAITVVIFASSSCALIYLVFFLETKALLLFSSIVPWKCKDLQKS